MKRRSTSNWENPCSPCRDNGRSSSPKRPNSLCSRHEPPVCKLTLSTSARTRRRTQRTFLRRVGKSVWRNAPLSHLTKISPKRSSIGKRLIYSRAQMLTHWYPRASSRSVRTSAIAIVSSSRFLRNRSSTRSTRRGSVLTKR